MSSPLPPPARSGFRPAFSPRGLATGIGSLPYRDPEEAAAVVLRRLPACPFWPQLPRRSPLEGMTLQYLEGFPALRERGAGKDPAVETGPQGLAEVEAFYDRVLAGEPAPFALSRDRAPGFYALEEALVQSPRTGLRYVKGHVTGPITLATSLKDTGGRDVLYDDVFREVVAAHLVQKALWQARRLGRFRVPVVLFLDEPAMEVFGSAYSTLSRETVHGLWAPALEALAAEGVFTGIHCCGNTDWPVLFESGAAVVNFDAWHFFEKMLLYPEALARHLERGGVLAWGAVPTGEEARELTGSDVARRLDEGIARFAAAGVDEALLRRQCLLTPSCGMGSLDPSLAERILDLLGEVSAGFEA